MSTTTSPHRHEAPADGWRPVPLVAASMVLHGAALGALAVEPHWWPWSAATIAGNHVFMGLLGLLPRNALIGANLRRLPPESAARREIAITFDDGPDPEVTPRVLEILARHGARCTFFCVGDQVRAHAALCREIVRRGHTVENHSGHHPETFMLLGWRGMQREVDDGQAAIVEATGVAPRFFRAPLGFRSPLLDPILHKRGLTLASWTRRGFDTNTQPGKVVKRLTRNLAAGDILLLHDHHSAITPQGTPGVLESLPRVLEALERAGLRAVTLREATGR
jgi:peptidoglycan/xylan/chitin deacetylase (PgdA/CDA1 family)